jgi:acyl-coenzyme A synthetase/AMP-(fatty) acid ligase
MDAETGKGVSYHEVYTTALSLAAFLDSRGFAKGDVACLVLPNSSHFPIFFLAAGIAGGIVSGASTLFTECQLLIKDLIRIACS